MKNLSRSKVELFTQCPHCFMIEQRHGIKQPPGYPFSINAGVDTLLKREFDEYRAAGVSHPIQWRAGLSVRPAAHPDLDTWRQNFQGIRFVDAARDITWFGAIDDLWVNEAGEYIVVDYKATAKAAPVTELADWTDGYKRQMEFYQWLLRKNGYPVSSTGYFLYCTGDTTAKAFNAKMDFHTHLIPYTGDDAWIEPTLDRIAAALAHPDLPAPNPECDLCKYHLSRQALPNHA